MKSSGAEFCIGFFDSIASIFVKKPVIEIIATDEDILKYLSLLIHVNYYYDFCRSNIDQSKPFK
jgi:hypothetical protein